jgi:hypothetical protein
LVYVKDIEDALDAALVSSAWFLLNTDNKRTYNMGQGEQKSGSRRFFFAFIVCSGDKKEQNAR